MRIQWRNAPYNKQIHLAVERKRPRNRYLVRQWRRLAKGVLLPIDEYDNLRLRRKVYARVPLLDQIGLTDELRNK